MKVNYYKVFIIELQIKATAEGENYKYNYHTSNLNYYGYLITTPLLTHR